MPIAPESLCEIWDRCRDRLALIARGFGEGSDDAVQEAFIELAKQRHPPAEPMAWLVRVTRNRMLDRHKTEKRRRSREQHYAETKQASFPWVTPPVGDQLIESESRQRLDDCLKQLPMAEREVVVMHVWGEMSFTQIAEATDRSSSGCHRDYHNAIKKIGVALRGDAPPSNPETSRAKLVS